jgi:hypothetical protein
MTGPDPVTLFSASGQPLTTVTPAAPAAGSGLVDAAGQPLASVAARIGPLRGLLATARQNWPMLIAAGVAGVLVALLEETFDEQKVVQAVQDWKLASKYLLNQDGSFDQAMPNFVSTSLPADVWSGQDRVAFDQFVGKFTNEVVAIANALELNADELDKARQAFHDVTTTLLEVLVPVCIICIAVIVMQYFPATAPYAEAVGFAGATITLATVAMVSSDITAALSAVTTGLRGQSVASFAKGAHPGDVSPNAPDPQLKQITIDWSHDQSWYMKANQDGATAH